MTYDVNIHYSIKFMLFFLKLYIMEYVRKHISKLDTKILNLKKENEILNEKLLNIENKYNEIISNLQQNNEYIEKSIILKELANEIEKIICQKVLGEKTLCHNLSILKSFVKNDPIINNKWNQLKKELKWNNYMYQTLEELKNIGFVYIPSSKSTIKPITEKNILNIIDERITNKKEKDELKSLINLLKISTNSEYILTIKQSI